MKIYLFGFTLLIIANSVTTLNLSNYSQCSCKNALQQQDCLTDYCDWNPNESTCTNKPCSGFKEQDCWGVPDSFNCVWNYTSKICETQTKCSNYTYKMDEGYRCYDMIKCQADVDQQDTIAGTVKCMDRTHETALSIVSCEKVPYERCRWFITSNGKQCVKNTQTQTCQETSITQCSDYATEEVCNIFSCYWSDTCKPLTCSAIQIVDDCTSFYSIDAKQVTICKWNAGKCIDLDVTTLIQAECLPSTIYSYIWNPDTKKCEICQEESSSSALFFYGSILLMTILN
ncbi:unnamed protein product [Paramecium sonneborni]|uniref:Mini antigen n=1 Tax=Paramecium sonneborni TaxID=65129 RepID=A0A8S1MI67_9CILI|nr:unnamed protein product [Paramecium sonneborni]